MTRQSYAKALDRALRPLGFQRNRDEWIRVRGDIWECVHRQSSWLGGVMVNLWAKDLETEKLFLEIFGSDGWTKMPPASERIGMLIDGYDRWWKRDEPDGPHQMAEAVLQYGAPWFDRVRTLEEQAEHWFFQRTALSSPGYLGPSVAELALTLYRLGKVEEACRILSKPVPRTAIPSIVEQVRRVRAWLGCDK